MQIHIHINISSFYTKSDIVYTFCTWLFSLILSKIDSTSLLNDEMESVEQYIQWYLCRNFKITKPFNIFSEYCLYMSVYVKLCMRVWRDTQQTDNTNIFSREGRWRSRMIKAKVSFFCNILIFFTGR